MNTQTHSIDVEAIQERLPSDAKLARQLLELARDDVDRLSMLRNMAYLWGCWQAGADADSPDVLTAWKLSAQASVAIFALAAHPGETIAVPLGDGPDVSFKGEGPNSTANVGQWLNAFNLAVICRDRRSIERLCEASIETLRASSTQADDYAYRYVELLRAVVVNDPRVGELLIAALEATDPKVLKIADVDYVLDLVVPEMEILVRVLERDAPAMNAAIEKALKYHRRYWETDDRSSDPEGFIALGPLAIAVLAHDRGLAVEVDSGYVPARLIRGEG